MGEIRSNIKLIMLVIVLVGMGVKGWGQVNGDFQVRVTGNWSNFASWNIRTGSVWVAAVSGQIPNATTSVYSQAGTSITVDNINSQCKDLIFPNSIISKIAFNAGSILSLYGNLDFGQTTSNIFPSWPAGAKLICTGTYAQSFSNNLNPVHKFILLEINKSLSGLSFPTQNASFENITLTSGTVLMNSGDLRGSSTATINVNGGTWTQVTGSNKINGGVPGSDILALNVNGGSMTLATSGTPAGYNLGAINITNGGTLNLNNSIANINVTNAFNIDATSTLNTAMNTTASASTNSFLGTVNYTHTAFQNIINTSYGNLGLSGGGSKNLSGNLIVNSNITIGGTAVLPIGSLTANIGGDWINYGTVGFTEETSTVNFNGIGSQSITTTGGEDFFKISKTGIGTLTQNSDVRFGSTSSELNISAGIFDAGIYTLSGTASTALTMSSGTLKLGKLSTTLPEFPITTGYNLTGGTIELNGAGNQELLGGRVYRNLTFSTSGNKTVSSAPTSIMGTIIVSNAAVLDVQNNSMGGAGTNLTMLGTSRYITAGVGTKPDATGIYTLGTTSTLEFSNTVTGTQQDIRLLPSVGIVNYGNVDVSGSNIGLSGSSSSLNMQAGTTFKVTSTGTLNVKNTSGFTGSTATAINNSNNPTISLIAGSTINYNGASQTITNKAAYQNLTLNGTGTKTAPSGTLSIFGNFNRASTATLFAHNNGLVSFDGTSSQTFSSAAGNTNFNAVRINNIGSGVTINSDTLNVKDSIVLTANSKLIFGTGNITLKSDASKTAHFSELPSTASIFYTGIGRFIIERYLRSVASWRLLATPVQTRENDITSPTITNSWREGGIALTSTGYGTRITGFSGVSNPTGATTGQLDEYTQRASMKSYNMATNTYVDITAIALTDSIVREQGYYVFVRGDRSVAVGGVTGTTNLRIRGKLRIGTQTFNVNNNAFQSVGNPFASQIDMRKADFNNLSHSFYVWDPFGGGPYNVGRYILYNYNGSDFVTVPATITRNFVESGEAFFVQNADPQLFPGSFIIEEADKSNGSTLISKNGEINRVGVTSPTLEINLHTDNSNGSEYLADGVLLNFDENYLNNIDNYDVRKITNINDNLGIKQGATNLVVERRKTLVETDTIRLNITNMRTAGYKFKIDPSIIGNLPLNAFLKDKFLQTETPVSLTDVTNVPFSITSDAVSKVADRFMIIFRKAATALWSFNFTNISTEKNADKTNTVNWNCENETNMSNYSIERSANGIGFTGIGKTGATGNNGNSTSYSFVDVVPLAGINYYQVKAISTNGQLKYSEIIKVTDNDGKPHHTIQPNPVINKTLNINFENMQGNYSILLVAKQGGMAFSTQVTVSSAKEVKNIVVEGIATGIYEFILTDKMGKKLVQSVYIN